MDILNLPGITGWPSWVLAIIFIVASSWYTTRSAKNHAKMAVEEAQKSAEAAQKSAIDAMNTEIETLRRQIDDKEKENAQKIRSVQKENVRLEHIIDTICAALKTQGIIISINGEIINISIEDPTKKITTVRIGAKDETP